MGQRAPAAVRRRAAADPVALGADPRRRPGLDPRRRLRARRGDHVGARPARRAGRRAHPRAAARRGPSPPGLRPRPGRAPVGARARWRPGVPARAGVPQPGGCPGPDLGVRLDRRAARPDADRARRRRPRGRADRGHPARLPGHLDVRPAGGAPPRGRPRLAAAGDAAEHARDRRTGLRPAPRPRLRRERRTRVGARRGGPAERDPCGPHRRRRAGRLRHGAAARRLPALGRAAHPDHAARGGRPAARRGRAGGREPASRSCPAASSGTSSRDPRTDRCADAAGSAGRCTTSGS